MAAASPLLEAVDALGLEFERIETSLAQMSHRLEVEFGSAGSSRDGANLFKVVQRVKRVSEMLPLLRERVAADLAAKQSVLEHARRSALPARALLRSIQSSLGTALVPDDDDPVLQRYLAVSRECEQQLASFTRLGFRDSDAAGGLDGLLSASDLNLELLRTALPAAPPPPPPPPPAQEEKRPEPQPPQPQALPQPPQAKTSRALVLAAPPTSKTARPGSAPGKGAPSAAEKPAYPPIDASEFEKLPASVRGACKLAAANQLLESVWRHFFGPGARRPGSRPPLTSSDLKAMGVENAATDPRLQCLKALKRVALGKHGFAWAGPAPGKENGPV